MVRRDSSTPGEYWFLRCFPDGTFVMLMNTISGFLCAAVTVSMCPEGTLTVGVTSDVMLKAKANAHMVASLETRLEGVRQFLR